MNYRIVVAAFAACCLLPFSLYAQSNTNAVTSERIQWNSDTHKDYYVDANGDDVKDLLLIALNDSHTTKLIKGVKFNYETRYLQANSLTLPDNVTTLLTAKNARILPGYFNRGNNEDLFVVTPKTQQAWLVRGSSQGLVSTREFGIGYFEWLNKAKQMELYKGDFNGDNIDDLLVLATKKGKHFLYHADKQGEFPIAQKFKNAVKWGLNKNERLYIGDFNNDGRDDIFALAKKRKKKNYIVYANNSGKLKAKHTVALKAKFTDYEWFADGFTSTVGDGVSDTDLTGTDKTAHSEKTSLIRMYNANGGMDTEGKFVPNAKDKLRFKKCKNIAFYPGSSQIKEQCRIIKKSRKQKKRQKRNRQSAQAATAPAAKLTTNSRAKTQGEGAGTNVSSSALAATERASLQLAASTTSAQTSSSNLVPATPTNAPTSPLGSYPRINQSFTISWDSIPDTDKYEIWMSTDYGVTIENTHRYTSGNSMEFAGTTEGSRFFYVKACNAAGCSGRSPYLSVFVYEFPQQVPVFLASPTTVTTASTINLSWIRPDEMIGTGGYYKIKETRPDGSEQWLPQVNGGHNTSTSVTLAGGLGQYNYQITACNVGEIYCVASAYETNVEYISANTNTTSISNVTYDPVIVPIGIKQRFTFDYTNATQCFNSLGVAYLDSSQSDQPLTGLCTDVPAGTTNIDRATNPAQLTGHYCWDTTRTATGEFAFDATCLSSTSTDSQSVNTVITPNRAPTAHPESLTVSMGTTTVINMLENDSDPDNHNLTLSSTTTPDSGSLTCSDTTCTFVAPPYSPGPNNIVTHIDTGFDYTISDGWGGSSSSHVQIRMLTPQAEQVGIAQISNLRYFPEQVIVGDKQTFSFDYANATECRNSLGNIYVPDDGTIKSGTYVWGPVTRNSPAAWNFTVTCSNGSSTSSANANALITGNDNPVANNDAVTVLQFFGGTFDVISNDSDPDDHEFWIDSATSPANGTVKIVDDGTQIQYLPSGNFTGTDTFTYTISDDWGGTATATVTVTVDLDPTGGLMAEYLFDDPLNLGRDTSGKNQHGTVVGNLTAVDGIVGKAGQFGTGIELDNVAGFNKDQIVSFNFWQKSAPYSGYNPPIMQQSYWIDNKNAWEFRPELEGGRYHRMLGYGRYQNNYDPMLVYSRKDTANNIWHMITYVTNGRWGKFYINGVYYGYDTSNGPDSWTANQPKSYKKIGAACIYGHSNCNAYFYYHGLIDEYRMYAKELSSSEISALYQARTASNNAPTGEVTISGKNEIGAMLTATHSLADIDGLGEVEFRWYRDGQIIAGASSHQYLLQSADIGAVITVEVAYLDGNRRFETVTSQPSAQIAEQILEITSLAITPSSNVIGDTPTLSFNYDLATRCYNKDVPTEVYYDGPQTSGSYSTQLEAHYVVESRVLTIVCENADSVTEAAINVDYQQLPAINGLSTQ